MGLNGARAGARRLLADPEVTCLVVEHRDRLARFGVDLSSAALAVSDRQLLVVNGTEVADDLVRDVTEVLTSLRARRYGRRGAANRARRALKATEDAA